MPKGGKTTVNAGLSDGGQSFRSTFGDRLAILLDLFDSRQEAADVAGVGANQLARYVRGDASPTFEAMARLCTARSVSMSWLWTGEGSSGAIDAGLNETVSVPLYDVRAGAGAAQLSTGRDSAEHLPLARGFLAMLDIKPENAFLMITDGPSMEETIRHGEPILGDKAETEPRDDIFVMAREGGVLVKRLQRRSDGSLMLISDNPAYQPELLPRDDAEDIRLIGRVKWVFRRL